MATFQLGEFLQKPRESVALFDFCELWRELTISALCRLSPPPWELGIPPWELAGKVRGALGEELKQSASAPALAGQACPWLPPCGLDVFFRAQGRMAGGLELPKPFVPWVDYLEPEGLVKVGLSLFGLAGDYDTMAAGALAAALQNRLRWSQGRPAGCLLEMLRIEEAPPVSLWEGEPTACLGFQSPLIQRSGQEETLKPASLLTGLAGRLCGLARWHGLDLSLDVDSVKLIAQTMQARTQNAAAAHWMRRSQRQGGREIPMKGFLGDLWLQGGLVELAPLLALGERCHLGGRTALGMGRYQLIWQ